MNTYLRPVPGFAVLFSLLFTIIVSSCTTQAVPAQPVVDINNVTVNLPQAKGVELVQQNCASCHTLRYIEIQPDLPKPAWKKIVKKMVDKFGAPIKDTNVVNQIIDYLATVKGKK